MTRHEPLQAPMHAFAQRCTNSGLDALFCTFFNANACNRPQGGNALSFTRCFKTRNLRTHNRSQILPIAYRAIFAMKNKALSLDIKRFQYVLF
jgi:hypothetical protein